MPWAEDNFIKCVLSNKRDFRFKEQSCFPIIWFLTEVYTIFSKLKSSEWQVSGSFPHSIREKHFPFIFMCKTNSEICPQVLNPSLVTLQSNGKHQVSIKFSFTPGGPIVRVP
jgi:hypothetical protein